jgi:hypothetical protein
MATALVEGPLGVADRVHDGELAGTSREPKSAVKSGGSDNVVVPTGEVFVAEAPAPTDRDDVRPG